MNRYFLHLQDHERLLEDADGIDASDLASVLGEALKSAREIVACAIRQGANPLGQAFVIADEHGNQLASVPFVDVLPEALK